MKTTFNLPESLLHRAKVVAAQRKKTLRELVLEGLEIVIGAKGAPMPEPLTSDEAKFLVIDPETGLPMLKNRGVTIRTETVDKIREAEGI